MTPDQELNRLLLANKSATDVELTMDARCMVCGLVAACVRVIDMGWICPDCLAVTIRRLRRDIS